MAGRDNRPNLSDLRLKYGPGFGGFVDTFQEAYPTIKSLRVRVTETELGSRGESRTLVLTETSFYDVVNCSNPICYGGGIDLGTSIRTMVRNREAAKAITEACRGYEGSPKGHRRYRSCMHSFAVDVQIEYHPDHAGG